MYTMVLIKQDLDDVYYWGNIALYNSGKFIEEVSYTGENDVVDSIRPVLEMIIKHKINYDNLTIKVTCEGKLSQMLNLDELKEN
jgi:hypothetical protein